MAEREIEEALEQAETAAVYPDLTTPVNITDEEINASKGLSFDQCIFSCDFNVTLAPRPAAPNRYLPDLQAATAEAIPCNQTSECTCDAASECTFQITSRVISQNCAIEFVDRGTVENNAPMTRKICAFTAIFSLFCGLSIVSGLRLMQLLTGPRRLEKISILSFSMQMVYDFCIASMFLNQSAAIGNASRPLALVALLTFIEAVVVDTAVVMQRYGLYIAQHREQRNRFWVMMVGIYLVIIAALLIQRYMPPWGVFICVVMCSSYWLVQSIYSFIHNVGRRFIPLDYLIVQTVVKYAPVCYFYGDRGNYMEYEVLDWYVYVMGAWFGAQVLFVFVQYIFGARLCFSWRSKSRHGEYKYHAQALRSFAIQEMDGYESGDVVLHHANEAGEGIAEWLRRQERVYVLAFDNGQVVAPQGDTAVLLAHNGYVDTTACMNPLHDHSSLFDAATKPGDLPSLFSGLADRHSVLQCVVPEETRCFYCVTEAQMRGGLQCCICMDQIDLLEAGNKWCQCIAVDVVQQAREAQILQRQQGGSGPQLWVTPCGHCFHGQCLAKWALENPVCPVDRQPIPAPNGDV